MVPIEPQPREALVTIAGEMAWLVGAYITVYDWRNFYDTEKIPIRWLLL